MLKADTPNLNVIHETTQLFERAGLAFLEKGYYFMPDAYHYAEQTPETWIDHIVPPFTLRKFVRRVARQNKRPFIQVWHHYRSERAGLHPKYKYEMYRHIRNGISVQIPRRKYTMPLVHCLLAADWQKSTMQSQWIFHIADEEFAAQYLSFFETREEFRRACRLPV